MLGEQISEGRGKRTARRVLETDPQFSVEVSFEDTSKMLGVDGMDIGTYTSGNKPDGSLYGEGKGVFATMGIGRLLPGGAVSYRGCLSYSTASAKLARLNSIAGVFEFEVDATGNTHSKVWEWK
jgi:hypothetical protein